MHGGITYSATENEYAKTIYKTFIKPSSVIGSQETVSPFKTSHSYGSTDVGDVSWLVPTAGVRTATWVPGTASHSWQAVASGGTSIGIKGAELAAKTRHESETPQVFWDGRAPSDGRQCAQYPSRTAPPNTPGTSKSTTSFGDPLFLLLFHLHLGHCATDDKVHTHESVTTHSERAHDNLWTGVSIRQSSHSRQMS